MKVRTDSKNALPATSPTDTIEVFQAQTQSRVEQWIQQLQDTPERFADIEQEIDQHYRQGGGQLVAHLLAKATEDSQMDDRVEQVRQDAAIRLRAPRPRTLRVRLLCGLVLWVTTGYCAPRRTKAPTPVSNSPVYTRNWQRSVLAKVAVQHCNTRWHVSLP